MSKQRIFKIRENLLSGKKAPAFDDPFANEDRNKPIPDIVWMRYQLTLKAMDKRFNDTEDMFDYIVELEDFIFSAGASDLQIMM